MAEAMSDADASIVADLAKAGVEDAMLALRRKAELAFNPAMTFAAYKAGMAFLEARLRSMREMVGDANQGLLVEEIVAAQRQGVQKLGLYDVFAEIRSAMQGKAGEAA